MRGDGGGKCVMSSTLRRTVVASTPSSRSGLSSVDVISGLCGLFCGTMGMTLSGWVISARRVLASAVLKSLLSEASSTVTCKTVILLRHSTKQKAATGTTQAPYSK